MTVEARLAGFRGSGSCVDYGSGQLAKLHKPVGKARGRAILGAVAPTAVGDIRLHRAHSMDYRRP